MAVGRVADVAGHASGYCPWEATVTGPVFGVAENRIAVQHKVIALGLGSPMAVGAAVTAGAVVLAEGAG
jgi:hypothetical protein